MRTAAQTKGEIMIKKGVFDFTIDMLQLVAEGCVVAIVAIVSLEIFMRYFYKSPLGWSVEICEYLIFALTMFGAAPVLRKGAHVAIDVVPEILIPRLSIPLGISTKAIGAVVCLVVSWFAVVTAWNCHVSGIIIHRSLTIPKEYFLIIVALGYFTLFIEFLIQVIARVRGVK